MADMSVKQRPKYLDIMTLAAGLPLPGKLSILHRVSGVGLFLFLPFLICLFSLSVSSPEHFEAFKAIASNWFVKIILAGLIWALMHHFCAGIRFLLLDMHKGLDKPCARKSAGVVFVVSLALTVVLWGVLL
jgi:succinate dehydrogenase / fumarate reductase cytochrome b subunit